MSAQVQDGVGGLHDADVYCEAREALDRISGARHWPDWKKVGAALVTARTEAMGIANTNSPNGKRYNQAFANVLKRERLDRIDSATRHQLLQIVENLSAIEEWREKLDPAQRLRLNHPSAIWRNWKRTLKSSGEDEQADGVEQSSHEREDAAPVSIIAALTTLVQQMRQRALTTPKLNDLLAAKPSFNANDLIELVAQINQLAAAWQERAKDPRKMMIEETSQ